MGYGGNKGSDQNESIREDYSDKSRVKGNLNASRDTCYNNKNDKNGLNQSAGSKVKKKVK